MATLHKPGGLAINPLYFYHLSDRLGLVLVSIPKNACTVQKRWLLQIDGHGDASRDTHSRAYGLLSLLSKPATLTAQAMASVPMIAFLRDPLIRIASAYRDKLVTTRPEWTTFCAIEGYAKCRGVPIVRDAGIPFANMGAGACFSGCSKVDYSRGISFREFVEHLTSAADVELDPHYRPQSWFMGPLLERLKNDGPARTVVVAMEHVGPVLDELGRTRGISTGEARRPTSDVISPAREHLGNVPSGELARAGRRPATSELYAPDLVERVIERFRGDVSLWRSLDLELSDRRILASCGRSATSDAAQALDSPEGGPGTPAGDGATRRDGSDAAAVSDSATTPVVVVRPRSGAPTGAGG